jgi:hypothetical protein
MGRHLGSDCLLLFDGQHGLSPRSDIFNVT